MAIPVEISYIDHSGTPRLERTQTKDVSRHGARVVCHAYLPEGSRINLGVTHLGRSAHCRVAWCSAPANGAYEVGLELEAAENIWEVDFASCGVRADMGTTDPFWVLVQMLEETGAISRAELMARLGGARPSPAAVVPSVSRVG